MCDALRKVFKVTRPDVAPGKACIYGDLAMVQDAEFDGAEVGDTIVIELLEMTEHLFMKLPDFEGW